MLNVALVVRSVDRLGERGSVVGKLDLERMWFGRCRGGVEIDAGAAQRDVHIVRARRAGGRQVALEVKARRAVVSTGLVCVELDGHAVGDDRTATVGAVAQAAATAAQRGRAVRIILDREGESVGNRRRQRYREASGT